MIEPNTVIMVRGNLTYSRTVSFLQGDALKDDIANRRNKGYPPVSERPYMVATVCNAQVVRDDPNAPETVADIYAREAMFTSKNNSGYSFTAKRTAPPMKADPYRVDESKNVRGPWLGVMEADGKTVQQIKQEGELDNGLDVTLVMRVFKSRNGMNNGVSLDGIILHEPVRYYSGANARELASRGIIFNPLTEDENAPIPAQAPEMQQPTAPPPAPAAGSEFTNTPPQQAAENPFPMNAPTGANNSAFGQPAQAPAPQQPVNNPNGFQGSESQGIQYDPSTMGRNY